MTLDYFYGAQADQFAFYRIPKALFTDERFKSISAEAKILYGILLDRMSLSRKNGWLDEQGRVFIIFTLEEVMEAIGCADQKATKLLNELDSKAGLIERKRQGLGKPNLIFVKNFVDNSDGSIPPAPESRIKTRENHDSADVNFTTPESRKSRGSNTDSNYTDLSETETYPFPSGQGGGHGQAPVDKMGRDMDEREQYRAILEDNLEYDILLENNPYDRDTIAEIMELLLDTICSKRQYIRIAGDDKPREVVKSQFLKLNCTHIEYVLSSFKENASKVRNIKQYTVTRGKNITFSHPRQKRNIRMRSLPEEYREDAIREVLAGRRIHNPRKRRSPLAEQKAQLVSALEAKQNQGRGHYYDLSIQNQITKQQARALLYYQQHGFTSADDFEAFAESVEAVKQRRDALSAQITSAEKRLNEIAVLQKHITNYLKTKDIYAGYRASGYSKAYYEEHEDEIKLCKASKRAFDELLPSDTSGKTAGSHKKQLPSLKALRAEYAELLAMKKAAYPEYYRAKDEYRELLTYQANLARLFGIENVRSAPQREHQQEEK